MTLSAIGTVLLLVYRKMVIDATSIIRIHMELQSNVKMLVGEAE